MPSGLAIPFSWDWVMFSDPPLSLSSRLVVSDSCDPVDCSLPGSSVHGILQARILEWVAISYSRGSSRPRNRTRVSCIAGRFFTNWAMREATNFLLSSSQDSLYQTGDRWLWHIGLLPSTAPGSAIHHTMWMASSGIVQCPAHVAIHASGDIGMNLAFHYGTQFR